MEVGDNDNSSFGLHWHDGIAQMLQSHDVFELHQVISTMSTWKNGEWTGTFTPHFNSGKQSKHLLLQL